MVDSEPFLNFLPSVIAASSVCLSNVTLGNEAWVCFTEHYPIDLDVPSVFMCDIYFTPAPSDDRHHRLPTFRPP